MAKNNDKYYNVFNQKEKIYQINEKAKVYTSFFGKKYHLYSSCINLFSERMPMSEAIKKGMSSSARIEQYKEKDIKISKCGSKVINKERFIDTSTVTDTYKLYRVKQCNNCLAKIDKYKEEDIQEQLRNLSEVVSEKVTTKMKDLFKKNYDDIELLTFDEDYA